MDISIKMILQELVRRLWIIILCAILGIVGAYFYTKNTVTPVYRTSMKVSALTTSEDKEASVASNINRMTLAERSVEAYIELFKSSTFYARVAEVSGTGYTAGAVGSMLSFQQIEGLGLYYVTITGTDPDAIILIAEAVQQEMGPYVGATIWTIDPAYKPSTPIDNPLKSNCAKGGLVMAIAAIGVIALIAFFDTRIKDEEMLAQRYSDIPVLGSIPDFTSITGKKSR